jgi:hypothetical protein
LSPSHINSEAVSGNPLPPAGQAKPWTCGTGTGVYINTGKTIAAQNKLALLNTLGVSFTTLANLTFPFINNKPSRYFPGGIGPGPDVFITDVYK